MWGTAPVVEKLMRNAATPYVALVMVGLSLGCGANETKGSGGSGGTPPAVTFQTSECGTWVQASCSTEIADCRTDPDCSSYLTCLYACPSDFNGNADPNCDAACVPAQSSTESIKKREVVTGCRIKGPGADCPACGIPKGAHETPPHQNCDGQPLLGPTPCDTCYTKNCCQTWTACLGGGNPDCKALADCLGGCMTAPQEPCEDACFSDHANSVDAYFAQVSCSISQCAGDVTDCDPTKRDACHTCALVTCGNEFSAFVSTEQGFLTFSCEEDCARADKGPDCQQACIDAHPDAADAAYQWAECSAYQCTTSC